MAKWLDVVALEVAAGGLRPARTDEFVLKSGDRLRGEVTRVESGYRLVHPVLGDLTIPAKDVETVVRGSPATIAASAPTPEICTRCPVPPEEKRSAAKRPWTFWIGVGLTNDSANTEKFQWRLDTEASYRWRTNRIRGRLNWFYEESSGVQTEGKFFASLIYERQVWSRGFLFAMGILDRDDFADILYRAGWFVGYGRDLIKREKTSFTLKLGAGIVVESRKDVPVIQTPAFSRHWTTGTSSAAATPSAPTPT